MSRSFWLIMLFPLSLASSCDDKGATNVPRGEFHVDRKTYDSIVSRACAVNEESLYVKGNDGVIMADGTQSFRYSNYEMNYLTSKEFLFVENIYRPDSSLLMSYKNVFDVPVGTMNTYDEKGALVEKTDWSAEYKGCKVDPYVLADFLELEGWYDRSVGSSYIGDRDTLSLKGDFTFRVFSNVIVDFIPSWDSVCAPCWVVVLLNLNGIPPRFMEKYGEVYDDGRLALFDDKKKKEGTGLLGSVTYTIDAWTGKSDVRWEFSR